MPEFSAPEALPLLVVAAAVFGLLWGSFLNVCIYRVVRDLSVITPRSFCPHCNALIAWYDNLPVLSYLLLRARCRHCRARIPIRYPLVELTTALLFAAVVHRFGFTPASAKWMSFETLMIVLFSTDLDVQILPDEFTLAGLAAGCAFAWFVLVPSVILSVLLPAWPASARSLLSATAGAACLSLPLWLFAALYKRLRRLESDPLGLGDVKLMALIGAFFGLEQAIPVFIIATLAGALIGGLYVLLKGKQAWHYELPFGTFLCAVAALSVFAISAV